MSPNVTIKYAGSRMQVKAPFHYQFRKGAIELGGRWRYRSAVWSFKRTSQRLVLELINRVFGESV
jgi:hypothetical protein